jgi:hypothetical protein
MVLFSMAVIMQPDEDKDWFLEEVKDLPTPLQWFEKYGPGLSGSKSDKREKLNL